MCYAKPISTGLLLVSNRCVDKGVSWDVWPHIFREEEVCSSFNLMPRNPTTSVRNDQPAAVLP